MITIVLFTLFILICCFATNDPALPAIAIAVIACGNKAKYHLPSFLGALIDQPKQTRARLNLYLFGDDDI